MPYDVAPGFVRFEYTSSWGLHVMIVPTRQWSPGTGIGEFLNWTGTQTSAEAMILDLANALAAIMHNTTTITRATIFTKEVGQPPQPVAALTLSASGTETSTTWRQAVQYTMTMRDTAFKLAKIVVLDAPSGGTFLKYSSFVGLPAWQAVFNELMDVSNGWSSRYGARPATFVSLTKTLNEKLRRAYRLA